MRGRWWGGGKKPVAKDDSLVVEEDVLSLDDLEKLGQ